MLTETTAAVFEDILRARRRRWPDGHEDVALAMHTLGSVLHVKGDYARAEPYLREALAMYEATLGEDHHRAARTRLRYGQCLADLGRRAKAEPLMVRAYEVLRDTYGPETAEVQRAAGYVAAFYEAWGRPEAAAPYRRPAASE